jgi:RNA polymerase sigma-70 factor (ECF subfamily)
VTDAEFMQVLVSFQDRVRCYVAGTGVPLADVDDIAQEVFLTYHRESERRPADVEPLAWLRGIARNMCNNYFRTKGRMLRHWEELGRTLDHQSSALEQPATDEELLAVLGRCIDSLPDRYKQMLRWYYQDDESAEEIGKRLRRSSGAIRVAMLRLRTTLRGCMGRSLPQESTP